MTNDSRRLPLLVATAIGFGTMTVAMSVLHDPVAAITWGIAAGALARGIDSEMPLALGVAALLIAPVFVMLSRADIGELIAQAAFVLLALGVGLEFRQDVGRGKREPKQQDD